MIRFGQKTYTYDEIVEKIVNENDGDEKDFLLEVLRACFYSQDGIYTVSADGTSLMFNAAYETITGVSGEEFIGKHVNTLVEEGYFKQSAAGKVLASLKQETIVQELRNGKMILVTSTPIFDKVGNLHRVLSNVRDMPVLKQLYEELLKKEALIESYKQTIQSRRKEETDSIISESSSMKRVVQFAEKLASTESTVLILGESGVGKGVIAKLIHGTSKRSENHLVMINCGAIPEQLLESELFGYCRGAFTGANKQGKVGLIEAADKGTIFLDEIGELPLSLQPKLLMFLETGEISKVGDTKTTKINTRVIAATNKDLERMVEQKLFREDLYYRLNVVPIKVPALKERKEDIIPLAMHFLKMYNKKNDCNKTIRPEVLKLLEDYSWPGNVRELRNLIERLVILSYSDEIALTDLPENTLSAAAIHNNPVDQAESVPLPISLPEVTRKMENTIIHKAIREGGSIRAAAKLLDITPSMLYRKLNK